MDKKILFLSLSILVMGVLIFFNPLPRLLEKSPPSTTLTKESGVVVVPLQAKSASIPVAPDAEIARAPEEISPTTTPTTIPRENISSTSREYLIVTDGCGPYFGGECLNVRSEPSTSSPSVLKLRSGMILRVSEALESEGRTWYKVIFDEWVRYPNRVSSEWYIAGDFVKTFFNEGLQELTKNTLLATSTKRILVDRSSQMLYAYENDELFMEQSISTGLDLTPTPRGAFTIFKKTPSRYMQGPLPGISNQYYDLPGVPWNLYFTEGGGAIHGAYWHDKFGNQWSHGCVNLPIEAAEKLYAWADLGTPVTVRD